MRRTLATWAQTTYLVTPTGNNNNNDGPWQSIAGVYAHLDSLDPGDSVLFERGEVFEGMLFAPDLIGSLGAPIVFGAYGSDNDPPVIIGSKPVTGTWTNVGGVWRIAMADDVKDVYIGGALQTLAREPDTGVYRNDRYKLDVNLGLYRLEGSVPPPPVGGNWQGASAVMREENWHYRVVPVESVDGGDLLFLPADKMPWDSLADWGYYLQNKLGALDVDGEWYHDTTGNTLYLKAPGNVDPNTLQVRVVVHRHGFDLVRNAHIVVQDLAFKHQWDAAVHPYGDSLAATVDIEVHHCTFMEVYDGISDLSVVRGTGHNYWANTFTRAYNSGIRSNADSTFITGNTFRNIGMEVGKGKPDAYPGYSGVISYGHYTMIQENLFNNIGYVGIWVNGDGSDTTDHVVEHNSIDSTLLILNDGAGIFFDNCQWLCIEDNIITNAIGNFETTAHTHQFARKASGIYFNDQPIGEVYIRRNTVSGCGTGINVDHRLDAGPYEVRDNTLFNNETQLYIQDYSCYRNDGEVTNGDGLNAPHMPNGNYNAQGFDDVYEGNILYSLDEDQSCMGQSLVWWPTPPDFASDVVGFGTFTGNFYFNPFSDLPITLVSAHRTVGSIPEYLTIPRTLEQWQALSGEDQTSTSSPLQLSSYTLTSLEPDTLFGPDGFSAGLDIWQHAPDNDGCLSIDTSNPLGSGAALMSSGSDMACEWIYTSEETPVLGDYRLSFLAKADTTAVLVAAIMDNYTNDPPGKGILLDTIPKLYNLFFHAQSLLHPTSAMYPFFRHSELAAGIGDATIWLDSVLIAGCTFTDATPLAAQNHILRYNDPLGDPDDPQNVAANGGSFELIGCWMNVYGDSIAGTVELEPWTSIVLYRIETVYDIDVAEYAVEGSEVWSEDLDIRGSVVIGEADTLTISGATIRFAPSIEEDATNILVQAGGTLIITNGAHLTNLPDCVNGSYLWDGVKALSNEA